MSRSTGWSARKGSMRSRWTTVARMRLARRRSRFRSHQVAQPSATGARSCPPGDADVRAPVALRNVPAQPRQTASSTNRRDQKSPWSGRLVAADVDEEAGRLEVVAAAGARVRPARSGRRSAARPRPGSRDRRRGRAAGAARRPGPAGSARGRSRRSARAPVVRRRPSRPSRCRRPRTGPRSRTNRPHWSSSRCSR